MATLRRLDAFVKPREDLRSRSAVGGLITLVAASAATILFLSQVYLYVAGSTRHSLRLSESLSTPVPLLALEHIPFHSKESIPFDVHVTFPHCKCRNLDISLDGASQHDGQLEKLQGKHAIQMLVPSQSDYDKALGGSANIPKNKAEGCTIKGTLHLQKVGGTFSITVSQQAWAEATAFSLFRSANPNDGGMPFKMQNVSHYVHHITFGNPFPHSHNPLKDASYMVENAAGGVFLSNIHVDLIPTRYQQFGMTKDTYQISVYSHIVQPETIIQSGPHLPGLAVMYDFNPLQVELHDTNDNIFVFISSLMSIVGGVFVTVGLVTGCLLHSAAAVAKKMD